MVRLPKPTKVILVTLLSVLSVLFCLEVSVFHRDGSSVSPVAGQSSVNPTCQ